MHYGKLFVNAHKPCTVEVLLMWLCNVEMYYLLKGYGFCIFLIYSLGCFWQVNSRRWIS